MAKNSLQDKFQTSYPYKEEDDEGVTWEWAKERAIQPRPCSGGYQANSLAHEWQTSKNAVPNGMSGSVAASAMNAPPVATDIKEWVVKENGGMPLTTMSETDVTNVVYDHALLNGFCYHDMDSVDDEYTGANQDHFYGLVVGPDDGGNVVEGFVERNNYLDRI